MLSDLTHITIPGDVIRVNADEFTYQSDPDLLAKVDRFMKE